MNDLNIDYINRKTQRLIDTASTSCLLFSPAKHTLIDPLAHECKAETCLIGLTYFIPHLGTLGNPISCDADKYKGKNNSLPSQQLPNFVASTPKITELREPVSSLQDTADRALSVASSRKLSTIYRKHLMSSEMSLKDIEFETDRLIVIAAELLEDLKTIFQDDQETIQFIHQAINDTYLDILRKHQKQKASTGPEEDIAIQEKEEKESLKNIYVYLSKRYRKTILSQELTADDKLFELGIASGTLSDLIKSTKKTFPDHQRAISELQRSWSETFSTLLKKL